MLHFQELTEAQQAKAVERARQAILGYLAEGYKIPEQNQTPWFFCEILYHDISGAKVKIDKLALQDAQLALYSELHDPIVVPGIA